MTLDCRARNTHREARLPSGRHRCVTVNVAALGRGCTLVLALFAAPAGAADDDVLINPFHDPVLQVTKGIATCPTPAVPLYTVKQYRELAHERSQRGVSCWLAGRCRLSNGYLYDAEIIPRVEIALNETDRFKDTSVWALGQRRRVWLRGCVRTAAQSNGIEAVVRHIDDVEDVQNELTVTGPSDSPGSTPQP
jgi:hypothetical protein